MTQEVQLAGSRALLVLPDDARWLYLFAHGAGAGMRHEFMTKMAHALAVQKVATLRWELPYMAAGKSRPDRADVAEEAVRVTWAAVRAGEIGDAHVGTSKIAGEIGDAHVGTSKSDIGGAHVGTIKSDIGGAHVGTSRIAGEIGGAHVGTSKIAGEIGGAHVGTSKIAGEIGDAHVGTSKSDIGGAHVGTIKSDIGGAHVGTIDDAFLGARLAMLPAFAGGKSFGGRMTSRAHAWTLGGLPGLAGLVFLGFPLYGAGKEPSTERADHLARATGPMLFVQGSRDELADLRVLRPVVAGLGARAELHVVDGADHGFSNRNAFAEIAATIAAWMERAQQRG